MGSGGGGFFPSKPRGVDDLLRQTQEDDAERELNSEVNQFLQELLADVNSRDVRKTQQQLEDIQEIVGKEVQLEGFLFGGSVAKHTYVDGLSDIDVLAIVNKEKWLKKNPEQILRILHRYLEDKLTADKVASVEKGRLAITVNYHDGTQIQVLPAIRSGEKVFINKPGGGWNETTPGTFRTALTRMNSKLQNMVIPTIKLAKAIIANLPEQKQTSGYHTESLAIEVFKDYKGPCTGKAMLQHYFENAGPRILASIKDITNQSRIVDSYLGAENSVQRKVVADGYGSISRRLNGLYTLDQWKKVFEG
ncbi:MAG: nucleotidyltransferase [Planctomycetaceae bacterium]|nr:nucleotidyltransferase [Planctomycetaceae bacterium]